MKADLARDGWWNATETLKDAEVLAKAGQHKERYRGPSSRWSRLPAQRWQ